MAIKIETETTKFNIDDKLAKVNDSCTVNFYDNGYMIEISGRNYSDDWSTAKMIVGTIEELHDVLVKISEMPKD